jgi:hypothetical protein
MVALWMQVIEQKPLEQPWNPPNINIKIRL